MSDPRLLTVKLSPGAARNQISGWTEDETGKKILKVSVTAVPEKGKANKALIELLAKEWEIPKTAIKIVKGETDRLKILRFEKDFPVFW